MSKLDKSRMKCNAPRKSPKAGKKKVVKACSGGKEKIIQAKDKLTARYWACKNLWAGKGGSTKSSPKNKQGKY